MNFKEQFPSMREAISKEALMVSKTCIEAYCLDKKKVIDFIKWIEDTKLMLSSEYVEYDWDEEYANKRKMLLGDVIL